MRKSMIAVLVLLVAVLAAPAVATAKPALPSGTVDITAVTAGTYRTVTDESGTYRIYNALVTVRWSGSTRIFVYLLQPDGIRRPPGELMLSGSGNGTVTVPGVIVPRGAAGVFEVYALKSSRGRWTIADHLVGTQEVRFAS